jgi:uncharacterized membrane protein
MDNLDKAKDQITEVATKVLRRGSNSAGGAQTLTISRGREEIGQFWRDPEKLSQVLGDIATVRSTEDDIFEWTLSAGASDGRTWRTRLLDGADRLRFVAVDDGSTDESDDGAEIVVTLREAPNDLGTEVTLEANTPVPDFLTGTALFTILYRSRALLQTGEVPTLAHNPSARDTAR